MTTAYCPYSLVVLLQLAFLLVRQAQNINLTTNRGNYVAKIRDHIWKRLKKMHLMTTRTFSIVTFCVISFDDSPNNGLIKKYKMWFDAKFRVNFCRGLGSFVAASVCWHFLQEFSKLFCAKPTRFKRVWCHHEPRYWIFGTRENYVSRNEVLANI